MKILYLSIAVWPSWEEARKKMWVWFRSVDRFTHGFRYFGVGTPQFPGYRGMKIEAPLNWLMAHELHEYTHIFYTDSADCLMLATPKEIEFKYTMLGTPPILLSAFNQLGNVSDGNRYPIFNTPEHRAKNGVYCYPNVGGFIMETPLLYDYLHRAHADFPDCGDDCFIMYDLIQSGWMRPELDHHCHIWQVQNLENSEIAESRVHNLVTDSWPCVLHVSGGYTDQVTLKDHAMVPLAEQLGILP